PRGRTSVAWRRWKADPSVRAGDNIHDIERTAMLDKYTRVYWTRFLTPTARGLLRLGVGPDAVTVVGTLGVVGGAVGFYPRGEFLWGTLVITAFVFADNVDGRMARAPGRQGNRRALLRSALGRAADAALV